MSLEVVFVSSSLCGTNDPLLPLRLVLPRAQDGSGENLAKEQTTGRNAVRGWSEEDV